MHDEVSETENIRKNLAIERMIVEGCEILLDTSQTFVRQGNSCQHAPSCFISKSKRAPAPQISRNKIVYKYQRMEKYDKLLLQSCKNGKHCCFFTFFASIYFFYQYFPSSLIIFHLWLHLPFLLYLHKSFYSHIRVSHPGAHEWEGQDHPWATGLSVSEERGRKAVFPLLQAFNHLHQRFWRKTSFDQGGWIYKHVLGHYHRFLIL